MQKTKKMSKNVLTLLLFIGLSLTAVAQLKKGVVSYDVIFSSDKEEMAMVSTMMAGSKMIMSFMPGKSRTDISMGMLGNVSTISDSKTKKTLTLTEMMGTKNAVESKIESTESKPNDQTIEITNETKTISGYNCTKANVTTADGNTLVIWFTKDIVAFTQGQNYMNSKIPGFPMEMTIVQDGLTIEFKATSVETKVDKKLFKQSIPEGYEIKTEEEMKSMGGQ
jgi:GLPGLI family protein